MNILPEESYSNRRLTGARCRCAVCGKWFNSTSAFDRHRYGAYGNFGRNRRCRTWQELRERGWVVNSAGFWIERQRIDRTRRSDDQAGVVGQEGST
jgi:hypothetical protein